jgi:hypothetical protein
MHDLESKIHWLAVQYAHAAKEAADYLAKSDEKLAESRKLHRQLTYWLNRQKERQSGRKMKIKPSRKRNPKTA